MPQSPELRAIVQNMIDAGESEANIGAVIQRMSGGDSRQRETFDVPVAQHPHARVASGAWNALKGMASMAASPLQSAKAVLYDAPAAMFEKSRTAETLPEKIAYGAAGAIPLVGPMAAHAGEEIVAGRIPELLGEAGVTALLPGGAKASGRVVKGAPAALKAAGRGAVSAATELASNPTAALIGAVEGYQVGGVPGAVIGGVGLPVGLRGAARMLKDRVKAKAPGKAAEAVAAKAKPKPKTETSELTEMAAEARELSRRLVLSPQETARLATLMERLKTSAKESGMTYAGAQPKRKG